MSRRREDDLFDPETDIERRIEGLPHRNDLVVATVVNVSGHGCYVSLDEYDGRRAYVHISEISRTWVKNIRTHVREGQRIVAKVLRVDPRKGQIDLSIKRVPEQMKKLKILEAKRGQTARTLFDIIIERLSAKERAKADEVQDILIANFELLYYGLEFASTSEIQEIMALGINETWAKALKEVASENIIPSSVNIKGTMEIEVPGGNGINIIKKALIAGRDDVEEENTTIKVYTEGSPRYTIDVRSEDYKMAEKALENALERIEQIITKGKGSFSFDRK